MRTVRVKIYDMVVVDASMKVLWEEPFHFQELIWAGGVINNGYHFYRVLKTAILHDGTYMIMAEKAETCDKCGGVVKAASEIHGCRCRKRK